MACYNIMAVLVNHRSKNASDVQETLTKHGCNIKMRLGLHEAENVCSEEGLIILQLSDEKEAKVLEKELNEIPGVNAKTIELCSD
ncbi:MAG TPA: ribose-5-phosphate isomerase A [Thermoanaerobacterales bacterium]|jgi:ribose 5-phosphate isomerase|nr:ribose-5-phosphate isomerase A [Thermoanaerobacterales bacterium]